MASLGTSNVRLPRPSFTYTNTLERWPPAAITFSAVFVPLHAGSWLMSIMAALGAAPSNFTTPMIVAAVAGSIGVAGAAGAAAMLGAGCSSELSFLPQPARRTSPNKTANLQTAVVVFVFIFLLHLSLNLKFQTKFKSYSGL